MAVFKLTIQPIDPIVSRDSRPFGRGQGGKARSLDWITPSTVCGALRSRVGKVHGSFEPDKLKSIKVRGPFLQYENTLYFPRPLDFVADKEKSYPIRPHKVETGGTEMPLGLTPASIENQPKDDFKPEPLPAFWSAADMKRWLMTPGNFTLADLKGLNGPVKDERVHVGINPETGASEDSLLFSTTGLDFRMKNADQMAIAIEAESPNAGYEKYFADLSSPHPLGGERRLADWKVENHDNNIEGWRPPQMQEGASRLRVVLGTPAIFSKGWLPGWIDDNREGTIPGTEMKVRLVSAVIGRWEPISGWSYEQGKRGIKPLRRMVPAGSVYFFDVIGTIPSAFDWQELWLRSVCDEEQDRNDGFGAALWGTW